MYHGAEPHRGFCTLPKPGARSAAPALVSSPVALHPGGPGCFGTWASEDTSVKAAAPRMQKRQVSLLSNLATSLTSELQSSCRIGPASAPIGFSAGRLRSTPGFASDEEWTCNLAVASAGLILQYPDYSTITVFLDLWETASQHAHPNTPSQQVSESLVGVSMST